MTNTPENDISENDIPEYVPDPEAEKRAKATHYLASTIRLLGVIIIILGFAIANNKFPVIPAWPGYILIAFGLFQMWVIPMMIVRNFVKARVAEEEAAQADEE